MLARRRVLAVFVLMLGMAGLAPFAKSQVSDWKQIRIPPLPAFHPQQPRRIQLPNGMVIFLQEDHELPLVRGTARIRGGSRDEPAARIGLVEIYGDAWRTGGTKDQTGDQLDDYLEARAARVETGGGLDSTTISFNCLKDNLDDVFKVFVTLLRDPEFRADKIPLAKDQINTGISRRNDNPMSIASREAQKLGYGTDSPYARVPEYATVAAVTRDDLINWHHTYVHPNNIILGVSGDFDAQAMEKRLRDAFESWPQGPSPQPLEVSFNGPKPGIYFVEKSNVNQSNIRMLELGTRRDNPDYYAIEMLNEIFGGSFASRLMQDIRTAKGLAYAVGGGVGTQFDHPGLFMVSMGTKSGTTAAAIDALYQEIDGLKTHPPTAEELKKAKDSILNSFVFRFDSKAKVLSERMAYEFYGYPADFLERYRDGIEKVTQADVGRVAAKYIHKDQLAVLVVGKAADFDRPLSTFGTVTALNIAIPEMKGAKREVATASNAEGKALLAKVIAALGGEEKVQAVKSYRQKASLVVKTPQGDLPIQAEEVVVLPDRSWQKLATPMGEMSRVVSPATAFMATAMGTRDLPASQKESELKGLKRDPLYIAQHEADPKFVFAASGTAKVGDAEAKVLDINADGAEVRWYIDPQSGRILRASWQSTGMQGPGEVVADYDDWQAVSGVSLPFKETRTRNGEKEATIEVKNVEFNPSIDPKIFEKPSEPSGGQEPKP